ncbi:MAG: hypothetical protein IT381_02060 [Deltaproteobacteria bacterium]|nr:hypothetical protein [Deltaproteobacteria bacterium]
MRLLAFVAAFAFCAVAQAEDVAPPAGAMDMTKMGPMTRMPKAMDTKGIDALYADCKTAMDKGDINAMADHNDYPVFMQTDDAAGMHQGGMWTREQWINEMKPMFAAPMPKDMKMAMTKKIMWHSDTLATVIEEHSMTMGKTKGKWTAASTVIKKGDKWMFKTMTEAGWGKKLDSMEKNAATPAPTKSATTK